MNCLVFLLKGLIVGLLVALPSGPVGFLSIKRAATQGFWAGFFTGVGSTFVHIFYGIVLLFGLTRISHLFKAYDDVITLTCSFILILLGLAIYNSHKKIPARSAYSTAIAGGTVPETPCQTKKSFLNYIGSSFLITITNPVQIVQFTLFFSLFSLFSGNLFSRVFIIIGLVIGSLLWAIIPPFVVTKVKHKFSHQGISLIHKLAGALLFVIGISFLVNGMF